MPHGVPFLVYDTYDRTPSVTRELPPADSSPGPGEWAVVDQEGNVVDRFADFQRSDPRC